MENTLNILKTLGSKMTGTQTFVVLLIFAIIFGISQFLGYSVNVNQYEVASRTLVEIERMNANIEKQNINIVDYSVAVGIYERTFSTSMADITRMTMKTLSSNHVNNAYRQEQIRFEYKRKLKAMYDKDVAYLNSIRYKDLILGGAMKEIIPTVVSEKVFSILFREGDIPQKRKDIESYLRSNIDVFLMIGKRHLNS